MPVFRVEKNKNYTCMASYHFYDKTLSWKAKGILSNMLSLPDDWDYSLAGLVALSSDGMSATRSAIKELEEHGYLIRRPIRKDGRISDWEYLIFENPQMEKQPVESQVVENQQVENQAQLNIKKTIPNELSTKESSTKEKKESAKAEHPAKGSFDKMIEEYTDSETTRDLLREWLKVRKAKRAAMTDRAIKMNLEKLDDFARQSGMSVDDYLSEIIRKGWQAFYVIKTYGCSQSNSDNKNRSFDTDEFFRAALNRSYSDE